MPLSAFALRPEEAQPYDPAHLPRTHRVGANESLYDIATRYQIPLRALIEQNHLEPPYALTPGRELDLPPPRLHIVAHGESLEDVAQRYNVDLRSLALLNRMQPPYRVQAGDRVVLPALAREEAPPPQPASVRADSSPATAPALGAARFAMPLRGAIVARFGAQPGGGRLDGIEIAGREGDAVAAAADGDVVYAGDDLPAYGTLVLVRHADNYVTAYGFARRALVREGQRVRAGEQIAELGSRPDGRARLLFQVRQGSAAVDPAPLLGVRD
jgi:murein DD-endopeptidase MepM/ murein hydrolase activator NlpD